MCCKWRNIRQISNIWHEILMIFVLVTGWNNTFDTLGSIIYIFMWIWHFFLFFKFSSSHIILRMWSTLYFYETLQIRTIRARIRFPGGLKMQIPRTHPQRVWFRRKRVGPKHFHYYLVSRSCRCWWWRFGYLTLKTFPYDTWWPIGYIKRGRRSLWRRPGSCYDCLSRQGLKRGEAYFGKE